MLLKQNRPIPNIKGNIFNHNLEFDKKNHLFILEHWSLIIITFKHKNLGLNTDILKTHFTHKQVR